MDDLIDYKDFNRCILLIVFKFVLNKSINYFLLYKEIIEVVIKCLNKINFDLKSFLCVMFQYYNECLENLDNLVMDEYYLLIFGKEVVIKIFIEVFEYSYININVISMDKIDEFDFIKLVLKFLLDVRLLLFLVNVMNECKRKL